MPDTGYASIRYAVDDVAASVAFLEQRVGFTVLNNVAPAVADIEGGHLRLLPSGPTSSGARALPSGRHPVAGGWNRTHMLQPALRPSA